MKKTTQPKNIKLENNSIINTTDESGQDFLDYIVEFCKNNDISFKFVGETLTVYPSDYNSLNSERFDLRNAYVSLIGWEEDIDYDNEETEIKNIYWIEVEENINSCDDLEKLLLKIRDTKQVSSAYYTDQEIFDRKLKAEQNRIKYKREEEKKVKKFQKKLKKYGMTENDFFKLQEIYEDQKYIKFDF